MPFPLGTEPEEWLAARTPRTSRCRWDRCMGIVLVAMRLVQTGISWVAAVLFGEFIDRWGRRSGWTAMCWCLEGVSWSAGADFSRVFPSTPSDWKSR